MLMNAQTRATTPAALHLLRTRTLTVESQLAAAGFASSDHVLNFVADKLKMARMDLDAVELGAHLAELIPRHLAERHHIVAAFATPEEVTVATSEPTQLELFDWLRRELKRQVTVVLASPLELDRAIRRMYEPRPAAASLEEGEDVSHEALLEATQIVDRIIAGAVDSGASDIHIEAAEGATVVRYRIDGMLRVVDSRPAQLHAAIVSRIKVLASLDIALRHVPQDGRIKLTQDTGTIDLRVSSLPTYYGEKICCRILDNTKAALPLDALGFDPDQLACMERMIRVPYGLVLVTGPTGSGKSTTLYGALNAVRSPELNIVSVEDPIEYQLPGINQVQVNVKRGLTFPGALRSILRQDPDVVLVGEIRDQETGVIAAEAALTGHLVMASLHTNDAAGAITRLTEMGIEPYLVAPSIVGVIAQRLLRRVCGSCAEEYAPTDEERAALGLPSLPSSVRFRRGLGCDDCHQTGYRGRTAIRELLEVDDAMRALISRGGTTDQIRDMANAGGFKSMRFSALKRLFVGETTAREVLRVTRK